MRPGQNLIDGAAAVGGTAFRFFRFREWGNDGCYDCGAQGGHSIHRKCFGRDLLAQDFDSQPTLFGWMDQNGDLASQDGYRFLRYSEEVGDVQVAVPERIYKRESMFSIHLIPMSRR